jgi:hypothetical protein
MLNTSSHQEMEIHTTTRRRKWQIRRAHHFDYVNEKSQVTKE